MKNYTTLSNFTKTFIRAEIEKTLKIHIIHFTWKIDNIFQRKVMFKMTEAVEFSFN